ncbi:hypothetical protein B0H11DRAFT_2248205 [Mycena galericulata]|nr:hypothetical protein B0H11DRAFT_2248205 [Mycena galericulata]
MSSTTALKRKRDPVLHVPYIVDPWQFFRHQVFKVLISWFNLQVLLNIPEGLALQNFDSSEIHIVSSRFFFIFYILFLVVRPNLYDPVAGQHAGKSFRGFGFHRLTGAGAPPPADPFASPPVPKKSKTTRSDAAASIPRRTRAQARADDSSVTSEAPKASKNTGRAVPKASGSASKSQPSASTSSAAAKGKSRASEREPSLTIYDSDDAELLSTITLPPKKSAPSPPAPKTSRPADPVVEEPPQLIPTYIPNVIPHDLIEDAVLPADVQNTIFKCTPCIDRNIDCDHKNWCHACGNCKSGNRRCYFSGGGGDEFTRIQEETQPMMATSNSTLMLLLQQVVNLRRRVEMSAYQYRANLLDYDDAINIFAKNYFYAESVLPESAFTAKFHDPRSQQLIKDLFVRFDVTRERAQYLAKLHYAERLVTQEISSVPRQVRAPVTSDSSVSIANLVGSVPVLQDVPHLATVSKVDAVPVFLRANPVKPFPVVWVPKGASPIVETSAPVAGPPLESAPHAPGASAFGEPFFSIFDRQAAVAGSSRSASAAPSTGHFFGNLRSSPVADGPAGSVPGGAESPEAPMDVA